jgi:hypothetical protein
MHHAMRFTSAILLVIGIVPIVSADDFDADIADIRAVGPQGVGSAAARKAARRLAESGPQVLTPLLVAMDTDNIVAANWFRTACANIVTRELEKGEPQLPVEFLREYVNDTRRQGRARRLVLELLDRLDPQFSTAWVPTRLDDPDFRDDAVAAVLAAGQAAQDSGSADAARESYKTAFAKARNSEQLLDAARRLRSLGDAVSIVRQMGFLTDWHVLGPFDAPGKTGFAAVFPPESTVDLTAEYAGQAGPIRWKRYETKDDLGQIDLVQAIGPVGEAVGYAYTEIESPREQQVELRCSADDNLSVWLNGEKIFGREQWLNGTRLDRFIAPAHLKAGPNRVLVKICQGPQHANPAVPNNWTMQVRFCAPDGAGAAFHSALPPAAEQKP